MPHRTQDTRHRTQETGRRSQDAGHKMHKTVHRMQDTGNMRKDTGHSRKRNQPRLRAEVQLIILPIFPKDGGQGCGDLSRGLQKLANILILTNNGTFSIFLLLLINPVAYVMNEAT